MSTHMQQSFSTTPSSASGSAGSKTTNRSLSGGFTHEMRDRQARGKDPYKLGTREDEDDLQTKLRAGQGLPRESYEERLNKEFAMAVLDSPEKLLMYAQSEGDSVAGQRLRFLRMMCPVTYETTQADAFGASPKTRPRPTHHREFSGY